MDERKTRQASMTIVCYSTDELSMNTLTPRKDPQRLPEQREGMHMMSTQRAAPADQCAAQFLR